MQKQETRQDNVEFTKHYKPFKLVTPVTTNAKHNYQPIEPEMQDES
jgi:hypothetical protein